MMVPGRTAVVAPAGTAGPPTQPAEQLLYARLLDWGTRLGLAMLVLSFAVYLSGIVPPHVSPERLATLWHLPAAQYLQASGMPAGWRWLALVHRSDIAGLAGIAVLAGCSLPGLLVLVPHYLRRGRRAHALLCAAVALVVALAASGLLAGGH